MTVTALILAAGAGTRYGGPKSSALFRGQPFLDHVVTLARAAGLDPIHAVVPPATTPVAGVRAVVNARPGDGLSRSLRLGLASLPAKTDALILLVDQPTMSHRNIEAVLAFDGARPIRAAEAEGRLGPPVLLRHTHFGLADGLTGDTGLRSLFAAHPELVDRVPVAGHPPDVDTAADLEQLERAGRRLESNP
jgi:CTP:molybdopterin cytidylyltransferase MocA